MMRFNGCVHINGVLGYEASGRTATQDALRAVTFCLGIGIDKETQRV